MKTPSCPFSCLLRSQSRRGPVELGLEKTPLPHPGRQPRRPVVLCRLPFQGGGLQPIESHDGGHPGHRFWTLHLSVSCWKGDMERLPHRRHPEGPSTAWCCRVVDRHVVRARNILTLLWVNQRHLKWWQA